MKTTYYITAGSLRRHRAVRQTIVVHASDKCPHCKSGGSEWLKIKDLTGLNTRRCGYCFG